MKKSALSLLSTIVLFSLLITSCNPSPEKYFDTAVLNSNLLVGFANEGLARQLEQPSVMLVEGTTDQTRPMKRKELIDQKVAWLEEKIKDIRALNETEDTKDIVQASRALFEYVIPVYKNEYQQLAKLYDEGAPKEEIQSYTMSIYNKHAQNFERLYNKLIAAGKPYAEKHKINVKWDS